MASTSSTYSSFSLTRRWRYDVFLSFRGKDVRYNFIDNLYTALVQRGICVFKDDEMLRRGEEIFPELLKAIEESRFAVVVFSKNYADSSWCLEELSKIMECQALMEQKVLPVFYHVDPSDVRGPKGDFATSFQQHEDKSKGKSDKVMKWREAATRASNLAGYTLSETLKEGQSIIITKIVQEIFSSIQPRGMEDNLIDIDSRIHDLNKLLAMEATKEVRIIGICGIGGIGKTTIAQALFRRIAYKFDGSSFVKDVRQNSSNTKDKCALQEKILKEILVTNHGFVISDPENGTEMIRTRFCNRKVLLVLDDIDHEKQLKFLACKHGWFGAGSRILITTRDEHLVSYADDIYKPAIMPLYQAFELFSWYAFRNNTPPEGFEELSYRAVSYTGYIPLALKVLGSYFHGRQASVWDSALNKLAKTPNIEIYETLKLSFDGLDVYEKNIFLDIACFFKGEDEDHVTRVLDSFGFYTKIGISVLVQKSLITVSNKRIRMHDIIQEMGWQIVRQCFPNSRLWQLKEIHDFISKNRKLEAIEAIVAQDMKYGVDQYDEKLSFTCDVFGSMTNLRLLDIEGKFTSCKPTVLPTDLQWLRWKNYPFSSFPVPYINKLAGIEMDFGNIKHLWKGQKVMQNLKFINLHGSSFLTTFPDVSGAPNIERLVLSECVKLEKVHVSLGLLKKLVYLDMRDCHRLKCLPFRTEMESLETLILDRCFKIEELPTSVRSLSNLRLLSLEACNSLKNIPKSIHELKNLKSLRLHNCPKLQKLPEEFGSMEKLEELELGFVFYPDPLDIWQAVAINVHALTNLCCLRKLDLSCRQIGEEDFPNNLHGLSYLEDLNLTCNTKLIHLPASIAHLSRLKLLDLNTCYELIDLHGLPSGIQVLNASNCKSLEKIADLSQEYDSLYKIWLFGSKKLLQNKENEIYLDKLLTQSFLMKWASSDCCINIFIPGRKIPSWFKEQQQGHKISLKLPPKWQTEAMGIAVFVVYTPSTPCVFPYFSFSFKNDRMSIPNLEFEYDNATADIGEWNVCIGYIPVSLIQQIDYDFEHNDWSHIIEGNLLVDVSSLGEKAVRCGAQVVYREDVESVQQFKPASTSSYWKWELCQSSLTSIICHDEPMLQRVLRVK